MYYTEGYSFTETYSKLLRMFDEKVTRDISPRGSPTHELADVTAWQVNCPSRCWLTKAGRGLNPFFAAAEIFWILSGMGNVDWISRWNKTMKNFQDNERKDFNAAYGKRLRAYNMSWGCKDGTVVDQVHYAIERIAKDPNTRRAVISLWHPVQDNLESKDIACTNWLAFRLRENRLHTLVGMRSNDIIWGTPYNMIQMEHLTCLIQGSLMYRLGRVIHRGVHNVVVSSLHKYEGLYDKTLERMAAVSKVQNMSHVSSSRIFNIPSVLSGSTTFIELSERLQNLGKNINRYEDKGMELEDIPLAVKEFPCYWAQVETLALLGIIRKDKSNRKVIEWCKYWLEPGFAWMVEDFLDPIKF